MVMTRRFLAGSGSGSGAGSQGVPAVTKDCIREIMHGEVVTIV